MHHREVTVQHPLCGVSPLYAAAASAGMGSTIVGNSASFFANMSRASGVLTSVGKIDKETADRLRIEWEQNFAQGSMGRTAVLGSGLEWKPLSINAADAQLIDQLKWNVEDVARCYRIPDWMISNKEKAAFRTAEMQTRLYYQQTLQFRLEAIEARLNDAFRTGEQCVHRIRPLDDAAHRTGHAHEGVQGRHQLGRVLDQRSAPARGTAARCRAAMNRSCRCSTSRSRSAVPRWRHPRRPADPDADEEDDPDDEDEDEEGDATERALQLRRDLAARIRTRLVA